MTQLDLFTKPKKLSRQAKLILKRLERGEVSNVELNAIAFRYSARILDIRRAGYRVEIVRRGEHGLRWYALMEGE